MGEGEVTAVIFFISLSRVYRSANNQIYIYQTEKFSNAGDSDL